MLRARQRRRTFLGRPAHGFLTRRRLHTSGKPRCRPDHSRPVRARDRSVSASQDVYASVCAHMALTCAKTDRASQRPRDAQARQDLVSQAHFGSLYTLSIVLLTLGFAKLRPEIF